MGTKLYDTIQQYQNNHRLSDLHVQADCFLSARIDGRLCRLGSERVDHQAIQIFSKHMLSEELQVQWHRQKSVDSSLQIASYYYRAHFYFVSGKMAIALRKINQRVPCLADLGIPSIVKNYLVGDGLVLVTGATGSGKSTSLASMLAYLMRHSAVHVLTIEDPIEYRFPDTGDSLLSQRALGCDACSFSSALRCALREDPDCILLGEVREADSAHLVLTAAETGHLVLTSLHASHCVHAISRLSAMFPDTHKEQVLVRIADSVRLIINQKLLVRRDGAGRVAAYEVLVFNQAVRHLVRENKLFQLPNLLETTRSEGMISMRSALAQLHRQGLIHER